MTTRAARAAYPAMPPRVGELMSDYPIVVGLDTSLADAAEAMDLYRISGLPVCDHGGRLVGVLSRADLVHAFSPPLRDSWGRLTARHVMTSPAITVDAADSVLEAARLMRRAHVHRLIVVGSGDQTPIGVLSTSDVVRWITDRSDG